MVDRESADLLMQYIKRLPARNRLRRAFERWFESGDFPNKADLIWVQKKSAVQRVSYIDEGGHFLRHPVKPSDTGCPATDQQRACLTWLLLLDFVLTKQRAAGGDTQHIARSCEVCHRDFLDISQKGHASTCSARCRDRRAVERRRETRKAGGR